MAKQQQFIRHLEFYGFPDQNGYTSDINACSVDLSDIIKKNKEQDKKIKYLGNEKADKKDLDELSGTVETLISAQTDFNNSVVEILSGISGDIEALKEIDNEYGQQLSALTDGVNDALCGIQNLGNRLDDVEEDLAELSGKVEDLSANTESALTEIWDELDNKLDKDEAEEIYAKKDEVPTMEELEEILEDYATKEWVEGQGYLTQATGDERYARKEVVDALSDRVNSAMTELNTKIFTVSGDLQSFSASTNARMGILETNFDTLRSETDRKINAISAAVESYDERITQNANDIDALEDEMARKANQADLEVLQNTVSNLSDLVDTKVSKVEFETYKSLVSNQFNDMDNKKADKTALTEINDASEELDDKIDQEREERISGDTYILNQITNINNEIIEIKEQGVDYGDRIQTLEDGLAQEILDRQQADLDLIGTEQDPYDADTIWGAKNFAKNQKTQAINEAEAYTDQEIANLRSDMEDGFNQVEQELSGKASKDYVSGCVRDAKAELIDKINTDVNAEKDRAELAEANLLARILQNQQNIAENDSAIDNLADRVNAITAWEGTDPETYVNTGNGVLDVLHREFHALIQTLTEKGILP